MLFVILLSLLSIVTGGIAAVVGFGIGSFLTPVLALKTGFGIAVATVAIAHFVGSAVRFWLLRKQINRTVLMRFGIVSAASGLVGALLQSRLGNSFLAVVFGGLMIMAGCINMFDWSKRLNAKGMLSWILGAASGFFGGLVGNQGGLRAAGLVGFKLRKTEFVATATAVALAVDSVRVPVYVMTKGGELVHLLPLVIIMSVGVFIGTILGAPLLRRLPEKYFKLILAAVLVIVGVFVAVGL